MGYFAQHQVVDDFAAMDASKSPFDLILDAKAMQDQEVRGHLGMFQLSGEDVFPTPGHPVWRSKEPSSLRHAGPGKNQSSNSG